MFLRILQVTFGTRPLILDTYFFCILFPIKTVTVKLSNIITNNRDNACGKYLFQYTTRKIKKNTMEMKFSNNILTLILENIELAIKWPHILPVPKIKI